MKKVIYFTPNHKPIIEVKISEFGSEMNIFECYSNNGTFNYMKNSMRLCYPSHKNDHFTSGRTKSLNHLKSNLSHNVYIFCDLVAIITQSTLSISLFDPI